MACQRRTPLRENLEKLPLEKPSLAAAMSRAVLLAVHQHDMATWLKTYNPDAYKRISEQHQGEKQLREWFQQLDTRTP